MQKCSCPVRKCLLLFIFNKQRRSTSKLASMAEPVLFVFDQKLSTLEKTVHLGVAPIGRQT
jgi:hypothetical protein